MMDVTETCITPTNLAAFLEGSLRGEERDRMVRHLNHCPDCFERYIGAARLLDAIEEEEASALSGADGNRAAEPSPLPGFEILKKRCVQLLLTPISLPLRSRRHAWLLPLGAAILAFVGVTHLWNVYLEDLEQPAASRPAEPGERPVYHRETPSLLSLPSYEIEWESRPLAAFYDLQEARREEFDEEIRHIVPGHQGKGPEGMTAQQLAFQLGARWIDLHPMLRSQSTKLTERALRNLREILLARFFIRSGHLSCDGRLLQVPEPEEIDVCLEVIERAFGDRPEFELGRWTEATRLAIAAGTDRYFTYTSVREFPERLLKNEETRWDDGVRAELERAGKLLEGGLSPGEGEALEAVLQDLARFYEMGE
jgi:hypothetical protein